MFNAQATARLATAVEITQRLQPDQSLSAIMLVGSVACDLATDDSDIDLVIIRSDQPSYTELVIEEAPYRTVALVYGAHNIDTLRFGPEVAFADLREVGRIATAKILVDSNGIARALKSAALVAQLNQTDNQKIVQRGLELVRFGNCGQSDSNRQHLLLCDLADVVCMLYLARTPWRVQKPKWWIPSLRKWCDSGFASLFVQCHGLRPASDSGAFSELLTQARSIVRSLQPFNPYSEVRSIRRARWLASTSISEAEGLWRFGDFDAAAYTARFAIQLAVSASTRTAGRVETLERLSQTSAPLSPEAYLAPLRSCCQTPNFEKSIASLEMHLHEHMSY